MKRAILFLSALVFLVLGLLIFANLTGVRKPGERDFRIDTQEELVGIEISRPGMDPVFLEEKADGKWYVNGQYEINEAALRDLIAALRQLEVRRPIPAGRRETVMQEMKEGGMRIKLYARQHLLTLPGGRQYIARRQMLRDYVIIESEANTRVSIIRMADASLPYEVQLPYMPLSITDLIHTDVRHWRNPYVSRLEPSEIRQIQARVPDNVSESYAWKLHAQSGLTLYDHQGNSISPEHIEEDRIGVYFHHFRRLRYDRLVSGPGSAPPPGVLSEEAFYTLVIHDVEDQEIILEFFKREPPNDGTFVSDRVPYDPNRFFLRINGQDYALAQYTIFQPVIRHLSWFLQNGDHPGPFFE